MNPQLSRERGWLNMGNIIVEEILPEYLIALTMPILVVYDDPTDIPGKFVVRVFDMQRPTKIITVSDSLAEARKTISPVAARFHRLPHQPGEDPKIVESYF